MTVTTYHVWNNKALLYRQEGMTLYGVLATSVIRGGPSPLTGVVLPDESDLRPATHADFHNFRVSPKYHLPYERSDGKPVDFHF